MRTKRARAAGCVVLFAATICAAGTATTAALPQTTSLGATGVWTRGVRANVSRDPGSTSGRSNALVAVGLSTSEQVRSIFPQTELDIKFQSSSAVVLQKGSFASSNRGIDQVNALLDRVGADKVRLFTAPVGDIRARAKSIKYRTGISVPDLNSYYRVTLAHGQDSTTLSQQLKKIPIIAEAYPEPLPAPPPTVPNFAGLQNYLKAAPTGVNAGYAASFPGGKGAKVSVYDIEYSWNTSHVDLSKARLSGAFVPNGTPEDPFGDNNHGTAVLGIVASDANTFGTSGEAPNVSLHLVNAFNQERAWDLANSINIAVNHMSAGDVLLIEQQTYDPNGYFVPVEWDPAVYDAIKIATASGVIVVEPAANGGRNLDDASVYGNPFPQGKADSGALMVGAGEACAGSSPPRSRLSFSNYGARVNLQGLGDCVVTTGWYGDLYNTGGANAYYTNSFSGTSSASPVVAAAAASLSSAYEALNLKSPTPQWVRGILIFFGTKQDTTSSGALTGHIGPLPDLARALPNADLTAPSVPTGVTATQTGPNQVTLRWQASTDNVKVQEYRVYRNSVLVQRISAPTVSYADNGVVANTTYAYRVVAVDEAGHVSAQTPAVSVTVR